MTRSLDDLGVESMVMLYLRFDKWCKKSDTCNPFPSIKEFYLGLLSEEDLDLVVKLYNQKRSNRLKEQGTIGDV